MPPRPPGIHRLPPELFPLISSNVPLYETPSTLLSLALTDHSIYEVVYSILYSRVILRNEADAIRVFERLLSDPSLGPLVKGLYIQSELTVASIDRKTIFDTVTGLKKVVQSGCVPHLRTLELRLCHECRGGGQWCDVIGFGHLEAQFWTDLRNNCPRIEDIILSGIGDTAEDPWLEDAGIYDLKGMSVGIKRLGVSFAQNRHARFDGPYALLKKIDDLAPSLTSLTLEFNSSWKSISSILALTFPHLESLFLGQFYVSDAEESMEFWRRHPSLIDLTLKDTYTLQSWFCEPVCAGLLFPKLRYLEANFLNIMHLLPILPQLIRLSIQQSVNAQVPYLLRSVLPDGLANLKSLEIDQTWSEDRNTIQKYEGSSWYEAPSGEFRVEKRLKKTGRLFTDGYLHSIVRGAPNIEELCLHGTNLHPMTMEKLTSDLANFRHLRRFYYCGLGGIGDPSRSEENRKKFYESCRRVGDQCPHLETITDISEWRYPTARMRRNDSGLVEEVLKEQGYGTIIGREDFAFPINPCPFEIPG